MSDSFLSDYLRTRSRVDQLERIESGGGGSAGAVYLTLTRTTTVGVGGAGAIITWQSEDRGNGISWSGSVITIPSSGYYLIDVAGNWNSGGAQTYGRLYVNGVMVERMANHYQASIVEFRVMALRFFSEGDAVEVQLINGALRTLLVTTYDLQSNSPYLHIVKVA
jgi:hypothetical protein